MMHLILALALTASADTTTQPRSHAQKIHRALQGQATKVSMTCAGDDCTLTWTPKPGAKIAFEDEQAKIVQTKKLARKWKDGTITAAEKDELLKLMVLRILEID